MTKLSVITGSVALVLVALMSGCASVEPSNRFQALVFSPETNSDGYWFGYDAIGRGAYVVTEGSNEAKIVRLCAEPSADATQSMARELGIRFGAETGDVQGVDIDTQVVILRDLLSTQRSPVTEFLKESLYRLCEQSINVKQLSSEHLFGTYQVIINTAQRLAQDFMNLEIQKAETARLSEENDRRLIGLTQAVIEQESDQERRAKLTADLMRYLDQSASPTTGIEEPRLTGRLSLSGQ